MSDIYAPKQAQFWLQKPKRLNILCGATRSGKTFINYDVIPKRIAELPKGNCLLVGNSIGSLRRNVIEPMQERFGRRKISDLTRDGRCMLFGRKFWAAGANDEASYKRIQGAGLVYCNGDEIGTWPESFMKWLQSRLSSPGAVFDGTCNPEGPRHWLKLNYIDNKALDLAYWHFVIDDNPFLDPAFVSALKTEYTGVWYQRLILGLWVAAEGAIYEGFTEATHVVDKLPTMRQVWVTCDYATSSPTVYLLVGLGVDGNYYIIDEWRWDPSVRHRQLDDAELADGMKEFLDSWGYHQSAVILDPAAESLQVAFEHAGIRGVVEADNAVLAGIKHTARWLGARRLFVHKRCRGLIDEMMGYVWDAKASMRGDDDKPVKQADHGPDALRYFVKYIENIGSGFSSWT